MKKFATICLLTLTAAVRQEKYEEVIDLGKMEEKSAIDQGKGRDHTDWSW